MRFGTKKLNKVKGLQKKNIYIYINRVGGIVMVDGTSGYSGHFETMAALDQSVVKYMME